MIQITPDEMAQLRATRPFFADNRNRFGALFYHALFTQSPELRAMFPDDLFDQERKLASTFSVMIDGAGEWERLRPILDNLALRHLAYQVKPEHYALVGSALLDAIGRIGATTDQRLAWQRVYGRFSAYMIERAYPAKGRADEHGRPA